MSIAITRMISWSNLYKSKKMRVASLRNDLPWFYNVFRAEKVQITIRILKFSGLSFLHNDSRMLNFKEIAVYIGYCLDFRDEKG